MSRPEGGYSPEYPGFPPEPQKHTRRRVLGWTGAGAGVLGAGVVGGFVDRYFRDPTIVEVPAPPEYGRNFDAPFQGAEANKVAKTLGINAGTYFLPTPDDPVLVGVKNAIDAKSFNMFTKEKVLPVFPPAVHDLAPWMEQVARDVPATRIQADGKEFLFPVNMAAVVTTIESTGEMKADSTRGAYGPMQIVPEEHIGELAIIAGLVGRNIGLTPEDVAHWEELKNNGLYDEARGFIDSLNAKPQLIEAVQDPFVGVATGMLILKNYHYQTLNALREADPARPISPNHPKVWERTLAAYNAGPSARTKEFQDLVPETQRYVLEGMRLMFDLEIAAQVQNEAWQKGAAISDGAIARELVSDEVNARAYALNALKKTKPGASREELRRPLSGKDIPSAGPAQDLIATDQREYYLTYQKQLDAGTDLFTLGLPISPGLRMYLVEQGESQLLKTPPNENKFAYSAYAA